MRIHVNPEAKGLGEFGYAEAGEYELKIESCEDKKGASSEYLAVRFSFVDPDVKAVEDGKVAGNIFDNIMTREDIQSNLRSFIDALGLEWNDFDTGDIIGLVLHAKVKVGAGQNDELRNEISRYVSAK